MFECVKEGLYVLSFVFRACVLEVAHIFVFNVVTLVNYIYGLSSQIFCSALCHDFLLHVCVICGA